MVYKIPDHKRDDGKWCRFSRCDSKTGKCPRGCQAGQEQTVAVRVISDQANDTVYEPWTDGHALGFQITGPHGTRYVYLNPSVHGDSPDVFLYQGLGKPEDDVPVCYVDPFDDSNPKGGRQ